MLLLCDFDGTLCDFNPDPSAVYLNEPRRALLDRLSRCAGCTVGIVSGRRLADVRARTGHIGEGAYFSGFHGLEIASDADTFVHPDATAAAGVLEEIARRVSPAIRRMPGVFIEDKALSIALHFRDADPAHRVTAQSALLEAARRDLAEGRIRLLPGSFVVELLPNTSWNKGDAVRWIRERVEAAAGPAFPIYIGDDVTDESAFAAVAADGVAIAASERAGGARHRVDGPAQVERLLVALAAALDCADG